MTPNKPLGTLLRSLCIVVLISLLLFAAVNVAAWYYLQAHPLNQREQDLFIRPGSAEGIALRKHILNTDDAGLLQQVITYPGLRPHSLLHFQAGTSRPAYRMGVEGVRYEPGWSDASVRALLAPTGGATFVLGGSTTLGAGVPADATLVAALNAMDPAGHYLNFGVEAYDAIRETDKLLYLLRKGYRPARVVFVDGLNDVTTFARSPYALHDSPRAQGLVRDRGEVPLIFGLPRWRNMKLAFAYSFPVTHLLKRLDYHRQQSAVERKSAAGSGFDNWPELMDYHYNWVDIRRDQPDRLAEDLLRYYRERQAFIAQLAPAFGFEPLFVYQPIGLLQPRQPFLRPKFFESPYLTIYRATDTRVRAAIASGQLAMLDCSQAIVASGSDLGYVDATHYSPRGNRLLAECILDRLKGE